MSNSQTQSDLHNKKGQGRKDYNFYSREKKKALFPFNVSQDLKMLGQRERFFFL